MVLVVDHSELRDLIVMAGKSQGWLADQIGVRPNTVWRWVNGEMPIPGSREDGLRALLVPLKDDEEL